MAEIELQSTPVNAGVHLADGAYLYTALVHLHRSSSSVSRQKTIRLFSKIEHGQLSNWLGKNAAHISRTYFRCVISPREVLARHTLFGYYSLALDHDIAEQWETGLTNGSVRAPASVAASVGRDRSWNLQWCRLCAEEELDSKGFASWRLIHQLPSVHICHIHNIPLYSRCRACESPLGSMKQFRLPREACANCGCIDFEATTLVMPDAYREFVQDTARSVQQQTEIYRPSNWHHVVSRFLARFQSTSHAEAEIEKHLCRRWEVRSLGEIWEMLRFRTSFSQYIFGGGASRRSPCDRILLMRAIGALAPDILEAGDQLLQPECPRKADRVGNSDFTSLVRSHATALGVDRRTVEALNTPLGVKDAAVAAGLPYDRTFHAWRKILKSMLETLSEDEVRSLLPKDRRFHRVERIGKGQDLMAAYKARLSTVVAENPAIMRVDLWREHYRAMHYLSRNDYEWLAKLIGGSRRTRRPRGSGAQSNTLD